MWRWKQFVGIVKQGKYDRFTSYQKFQPRLSNKGTGTCLIYLPWLWQKLMSSNFGQESLESPSSLLNEFRTESSHGLLFWHCWDNDSGMVVCKNRGQPFEITVASDNWKFTCTEGCTISFRIDFKWDIGTKCIIVHCWFCDRDSQITYSANLTTTKDGVQFRSK